MRSHTFLRTAAVSPSAARPRLRLRRRALAAALSVAVALSVAAAPGAPAAAPPAAAPPSAAGPAGGAAKPAIDPAAAAILDAHVAATGGAAARARVRTSVSRGQLSIPAQGVAFDLTITSARPASIRVRLESAALGTIESGADGAAAWQLSTMGGPRLLAGAELEQALEDARFDRFGSWREAFATVSLAGADTLDGRPCDKIAATTPRGKALTFWFDRATHLLAATEMTAETAMGKVPLRTFHEDYRPVGALQEAFRLRIVAAGQERLTTLTGIEHNVELAADAFTPPPEIRQLQIAPTTGGAATADPAGGGPAGGRPAGGGG